MQKWIFLVFGAAMTALTFSCASKPVGDHVLTNRQELQGKSPVQVATTYKKYVYAGWFREKTDYILVYPKASFERSVASEDETACLEVHFEREDRFLHSGWLTERSCAEFRDKKNDETLLRRKN